MQRTISSNLEEVRLRIDKACKRVGRDPKEVCLIAVSKTWPAEDIDAAAACGITDVGENKVQEVVAKKPNVRSDVRWHLIGHLQSNKVKNIIDKVDVIQSVDSIHIAEEINKRAEAAGLTMDVLLQVNVAAEPQKYGFDKDEVLGAARYIKQNFNNVKIRGLMQIAPYAENPEDVRVYFKELSQLFGKLKDELCSDADMLSMGMSGDFEIAVEEGATHIRVGSAIFGKRDYTR